MFPNFESEMTKTSHKQNRPFDFKLINLVEPHPVLYRREHGLSTYEYMKARTEIWKQIAAKMGADTKFCISRWGNLRCQYTKELRQCHYLCPKLGIIKGSSWPYFERLKFLEGTVQFNRPKRTVTHKRIQKEHDKDLEWSNTESSDHEKSESSKESQIEYKSNILDPNIPRQEEEMYAIECNNSEHCNESLNVDGATVSNVQKFTTIFNELDNANRLRVERRIMAFLCKCQLKALVNEDVDDLVV